MPAGLWQLVGETGWQLSHGVGDNIAITRSGPPSMTCNPMT
jgi:hypothetical protein